MMENFQAMHAAYENRLNADVREKMHAQDLAGFEALERRGQSDVFFQGLRETKPEPVSQAKVTALLQPPSSDDNWLLNRALIVLMLACFCFLVWKAWNHTGECELTIDDVPDDELMDAFEPEIAKLELQRRFAHRARSVQHLQN